MILPARGGEIPLYQQVKDALVERILSGDWAEGTRIPSENELTRSLGISRMTANRALRELTAEGWLERVQGAGTYVAEAKPQSAVLEIRSIADEIAGRGHRHAAEVRALKRCRTRALEARMLGLERGQPAIYSVILHRENGIPVQLETRWVNPAVAPDYLAQDFRKITPYDYLISAAPLSRAEHTILAVLPSDEEAALLEIDSAAPCLLLRRRTWSGDQAVTWAHLLHPGERYRLGGSFRGPGETPSAA